MLIDSLYFVLTAESAVEALDILAADVIHVVVCDEKLPFMQGLEFLAQVRRRRPNTMRLILSSSTGLQEVLPAIIMGEVHRYVQKPVRSDDLHCVIHQLLERSRLLREVDRLIVANERQKTQLEAFQEQHLDTEIDIQETVKDEAFVLDDAHSDIDQMLVEVTDLLATLDFDDTSELSTAEKAAGEVVLKVEEYEQDLDQMLEDAMIDVAGG